ncbi:pyrophosphatase [Rhodococcus phage Finch]|uniref:Nucleotide pyrophosphohydrolase n=1 Tax=Rhodococcus phage Finch TaxID=2094144 RepID=A0A2P1JXN9_9CAUD|nr:pyrophosphatase [Rhodococcus phage Finch]AVO25103.1 nucleotide pyrophosphohydrolase [Rhodococcus phage Finch]
MREFLPGDIVHYATAQGEFAVLGVKPPDETLAKQLHGVYPTVELVSKGDGRIFWAVPDLLTHVTGRNPRIDDAIPADCSLGVALEATQDDTLSALLQLADRVHLNATEKGWHEPRSFGDAMVMVHAEVTEAIDEYRAGHDYHEVYYSYEVEDPSGTKYRMKTDQSHRVVDGDLVPNKPEGTGVEMADAVIRLLDEMVERGVPIERVFREKIAYNETRSYRHGGAKI